MALAALLTCLLPAAASAQIRFTNVTSAAGLGAGPYDSPSSHSLGVNWVDFDRDGWSDLFVVGGEEPPHLFRNQRDGTFAKVDQLLPTLPSVEMSGSRFADYDRDGDPDLFIYTDNDDWRINQSDNLPDGPPALLLRNLLTERGTPTFERAAAQAGVEDLAKVSFGDLPGYRGKTASWFDYDRDGCIDLYLGHMVINLRNSSANQDRLYRNRCDGTFEDATDDSGIGSAPYRPALASGAFHLDDDLWPDLYVVNVSKFFEEDHRDLVYYNNRPERGRSGRAGRVDGGDARHR